MIAALGVWYYSGRAERRLTAENIDALSSAAYRLQCRACEQIFEAPAREYFVEVGDEGLKCIHCGQMKAWRIGLAGDESEAFKADAATFSSVEELRDAAEDLRRQIGELEARLNSAEGAPDPAMEAALQQQLAPLRARFKALCDRWDELTPLDSGSIDPD